MYKVEEALRKWVHHSELNRCNHGSDTCESWPVVEEIMRYIRPSILERIDEAEREGYSAAEMEQDLYGTIGGEKTLS